MLNVYDLATVAADAIRNPWGSWKLLVALYGPSAAFQTTGPLSTTPAKEGRMKTRFSLMLRNVALQMALLLTAASPAFGGTLHLVTVADGMALPGVSATAKLSGSGRTITTSSASGEIAFSDIPPGSYRVTYEQPWRAEFDLCVPYAGLFATLDIGLPVTSCCRIVACEACAPPFVELHGRVVDEVAAPVSGSYVSLPDGETTRSDSDGNFTLYIRGGNETRLTVSAPGYVTRAFELPCDLTSWIVTLPRTCDGRTAEKHAFSVTTPLGTKLTWTLNGHSVEAAQNSLHRGNEHDK